MVQTLPYISIAIFGGCCIFHAKYFWRGFIISTENYIWNSSLFIVTFSLPNISGAAVSSLLSATYGTVLHTGLINILYRLHTCIGFTSFLNERIPRSLDPHSFANCERKKKT